MINRNLRKRMKKIAGRKNTKIVNNLYTTSQPPYILEQSVWIILAHWTWKNKVGIAIKVIIKVICKVYGMKLKVESQFWYWNNKHKSNFLSRSC